MKTAAMRSTTTAPMRYKEKFELLSARTRDALSAWKDLVAGPKDIVFLAVAWVKLWQALEALEQAYVVMQATPVRRR